MKYSFVKDLILFQPTIRHGGIRKHVRTIKKIEIPSIPITNSISENGSQEQTSTNWNLLVELSKQTHKISETGFWNSRSYHF